MRHAATHPVRELPLPGRPGQRSGCLHGRSLPNADGPRVGVRRRVRPAPRCRLGTVRCLRTGRAERSDDRTGPRGRRQLHDVQPRGRRIPDHGLCAGPRDPAGRGGAGVRCRLRVGTVGVPSGRGPGLRRRPGVPARAASGEASRPPDGLLAAQLRLHRGRCLYGLRRDHCPFRVQPGLLLGIARSPSRGAALRHRPHPNRRPEPRAEVSDVREPGPRQGRVLVCTHGRGAWSHPAGRSDPGR